MMQKMLGSCYVKPMAIYLVVALLAISALSGTAHAMFLPASTPDFPAHRSGSLQRSVDLERIQTALELKVVQQRLVDYGLSPEDAQAKVRELSDEQLHQLAANLDALQPGGDAVGTVIGLLVIALLVVLLIYLLEGRVEIRKK